MLLFIMVFGFQPKVWSTYIDEQYCACECSFQGQTFFIILYEMGLSILLETHLVLTISLVNAELSWHSLVAELRYYYRTCKFMHTGTDKCDIMS